jgi:hypothetical protein
MALDWDGWLTPHPSHFTPGKETRYPFYSIEQEAARASGPVWTGRKNLVPIGVRCLDSIANDIFLLKSKWHKEIFNDACFHHVFVFRYVQSYDGYSSHPFITPINKNITNSSTRLILKIRKTIILLVAELYLL